MQGHHRIAREGARSPTRRRLCVLPSSNANSTTTDFIARHKSRSGLSTKSLQRDSRNSLAALFEYSGCFSVSMVLLVQGLVNQFSSILHCTTKSPAVAYGYLDRADAKSRLNVGELHFVHDIIADGYATYHWIQRTPQGQQGKTLDSTFFTKLLGTSMVSAEAFEDAYAHVEPFLRAHCTLLVLTIDEPRPLATRSSSADPHPVTQAAVLFQPDFRNWRDHCKSACDGHKLPLTHPHLTFLRHSRHQAARSSLEERCNGLNPG
jgi:hypothetical protein